jgi:hypothetical protein
MTTFRRPVDWSGYTFKWEDDLKSKTERMRRILEGDWAGGPVLREVVVLEENHPALGRGEIVSVRREDAPTFDGVLLWVSRPHSKILHKIYQGQTKPYTRPQPTRGGLMAMTGGDPRKGTTDGNRDREEA